MEGVAMNATRIAIALLAASVAWPSTASAEMWFDRADFGQPVLTERQSATANDGIVLEQAFGQYANEPVREYSARMPFRRLGRAVGRLDVLTDLGVAPCTAFVVSKNYLVTNHHCVPGIVARTRASRVDGVSLTMGYTRTGVPEGTATFRVNPNAVEADERLDYAVLEVFGDPSRDWGTLTLSAEAPLKGDAFWIVGHPMGGEQRVSREKCGTGDPAIAGGRVRHTCDTLPGNSGSPVIDVATQKVVALHHAGSKRDAINFAIPMDAILKHSKVLSGLAAPAPTAPAPAPTVVQTPPKVPTRVAAVDDTSTATRPAKPTTPPRREVAVKVEPPTELLTEPSPEPVPAPKPFGGGASQPVPPLVAKCDRLAAVSSPFHPRGAAGVKDFEVDIYEAVQTCTEAVVKRHKDPSLRFQLGRVLFLLGSKPQAIKFMREGADGGFADAQMMLGTIYANGDGVFRSRNIAVSWFRKAAAQGHEGARQALAQLGAR